MNDTIYHILLLSFGMIFVTTLTMLYLNRAKLFSPAHVTSRVSPSPVKVIKSVDPHARSRVKWKHPANHKVLMALKKRRVGDTLVDVAAEDVFDVPGCHPQITAYVHETLRGPLPIECRWIIYGFPVLVNPKTGVIFAFGIGTECVALRLPVDARNDSWIEMCDMKDDGLTSEELGSEWAFMQDVAQPDEPRLAYEFAE